MASQVDVLPQYDRVVFTRSPLELCLAEVRYPSIPGFPDEAAQVRLRKELGATYPEFRNERTMNLVVTPQGVSQQAGPVAWRFSSLDKQWSLIVTETSAVIETRRYGSFEEFARRTLEAVQVVRRVLEVAYQTRFGLRYINEIRHPDGGDYDTWRRLLNSDLLGLSGTDLLGGSVEQTIGEVRIRREDGALLVRHGFLQGTSVAPIEGSPPTQGHFYLLDADYSNEEPGEVGANMEARLTAYHVVLYRLFRWAIGDGDLYRYLGAKS